MAILVVFGGFGAAMVLCEAVLRRRKAQFATGALVLIHFLVFLATVFCAGRTGEVSAVSILLFWLGAFPVWFGVRSHIESSILLRMLSIILRSGGAMAPAVLTRLYDQEYGAESRLRELEGAGFISRKGGRIEMGEKGRRAEKIHRLATFYWPR